MRNDYVDLVLVKQGEKNYLFMAPEFSHLEEGETVLCDTEWGKREGVVSKVATVDPTSEEYDLVTSMEGVTLPLKRILGRLTLREFMYEEE